jgi:hypothetical protein
MSSATFNALAANLAGLADDADARGMILAIKAQEFAAREKHSDTAAGMFGLLATSLLPHVNEASAVVLAREVAHRIDCPAPIIRALLERRDASSLCAIAMAAHLDPFDRALALTSGPRQALALAGRSDLDPEAVAILLARDDLAVTQAIIANRAVELPPDLLDRLIDRARCDRLLGRVLLDSERDLGSRAAALFLSANPAERRTMTDRAAALARLDPVAEIAAVSEAGHLAIERSALAGDHGSLVAHLEQAGAIEPTLAAAIADDGVGEALAIFLRAIGMPEAAAERCLLIVHSGRGASTDAVLALVRFYRQLNNATARRLLALMAGSRDLPKADEKPIARNQSGGRSWQRHRAIDQPEARRTMADKTKAAGARAS